MENNNNLSISAEQYKGTDIYKGIYNDNLEKNLEKGFSETPEVKDNEKPKPPTVEETHADELKAKQLKQEISQKMDKKHSYDKMSNEEKRALRILINIDGKSAKEKIESVMEHFGVSKMGAINILADATNHLKETMPDEDEEGGEAPVDEKKEKELNKAFGIDDDYLEKGRGLPIGTINKYGEVKTADGWKHIKKGQRSSSHDAAIAHSKKTGEHVTPDHDLHPDKGDKSTSRESSAIEGYSKIDKPEPVVIRKGRYKGEKGKVIAVGTPTDDDDPSEGAVQYAIKVDSSGKYTYLGSNEVGHLESMGDVRMEKEAKKTATMTEMGREKVSGKDKETVGKIKEMMAKEKKEDTKGGEGFSKGKTYSPKSNIEVLSFSGNKQVKLSPSDKLQYTGQVIPLKGEPHHILSGSNKKVAIPVSELDSMSSKFSEGGAKTGVDYADSVLEKHNSSSSTPNISKMALNKVKDRLSKRVEKLASGTAVSSTQKAELKKHSDALGEVKKHIDALEKK